MWISRKKFNELEKKVDKILHNQKIGNQQTPLSSITYAVQEGIESGLNKNRSAEINVEIDGKALYEAVVSSGDKTSTVKIDEKGIILRTW